MKMKSKCGLDERGNGHRCPRGEHWRRGKFSPGCQSRLEMQQFRIYVFKGGSPQLDLPTTVYRVYTTAEKRRQLLPVFICIVFSFAWKLVRTGICRPTVTLIGFRGHDIFHGVELRNFQTLSLSGEIAIFMCSSSTIAVVFAGLVFRA